ncbi:MAG: alkaline phosphatase D family protein [Thermoleophilaceae bacterium]
MTELLLGPVLRYVDATNAVIWVETGAACEVEVLGATAPTFQVEGHHYGVVSVGDLEPGHTYEYEVALDGERVWPLEDSEFPASRIRTYADDLHPKIFFGSCRVAVPNDPPYTLTKDEDDEGREVDALRAKALRMRHEDPDTWPDLLLWVGDQIYADEVSPETRKFIEGRRDTSEEPGEIALDFEEYTKLYYESWKDPVTRWLLSTVSSAMIFDDHDIHDDWNTSAAWVEAMRATDWWADHIECGLMSYWIYQHVGNLSPAELREDGLLGRLQKLTDGSKVLRQYARGSDREAFYSRWSYYRDIGRTRLVVIDSRCGRVLEEGKRSMLDEDEWQWVEDHATGGFDHLLHSDLGALAAGPGDASPGGLERGRVRRGLGRPGRPDRREDPPGGRPGALARLPGVLRASGPHSARGRSG